MFAYMAEDELVDVEIKLAGYCFMNSMIYEGRRETMGDMHECLSAK